MDSPLNTFDCGRDEEYEDLFGTQISPDMAGLEVPTDDHMLLETQLDTVEHQQLDGIIKQEDMVPPIGNFGRSSTSDIIDLCESDDDQDVTEADEVDAVYIKTERMDVPFLWNEMGADIIDIADSDQEVQKLASSPIPSSSETTVSCHLTAGSLPSLHSVNLQDMAPATKRTTPGSENLQQAGRPSSARHNINAIVTGAGSIFRGNLSQAVEPNRSTSIFSPAVKSGGDAAEA